MDFDIYRRIVFERIDRILIVTFNRPDKLNAVDQDLHNDIYRLFLDLQADRDIDVIVLTGAGRGFCAGGDVSRMDSPTGSGIDHDWNSPHMDPSFLDHMLACDKPVISMVNGPAIGMGCTIALMADICIAADDALLGDSHVSVGLVAGDGCAALFPMFIGPSRAKELLMLGSLITGKEAAAMGLVNHSVPLAQLRDFTMDIAQRLARQPRFAMRATKASVNRYMRDVINNVQEAAGAWEWVSMGLEAHHEAAKAFADRRRLGK
jgi:enoyl-CoA hydratase